MLNSQRFSSLLFYCLGITALSIGLGVQIIVLPWLVVDFLQLGSRWVGWMQAAILIPNLFLLLLGGVSTDRRDNKSWPVALIILNAAMHLGLALVIKHNLLTIVLLLFYAVVLGVSNAFIQPWKEYLLKSLNSEQLQKVVAKSSLCVYGGQAIGIVLASTMAIIGVEKLLLLQVLFISIAALSFYCLLQKISSKNTPELTVQTAPHVLLVDGVKDMWASSSLRYLIAIVAFNGFFHLGVFIVALPILVQQVYGATVGLFSSLQLAFVIGTIVTTVIIIYRGFLDAPGRRIIFSLLYGGVILLAISAKPTMWGLLGLVFFWGVVVGVSSNMGRAVLQSLAPEACRGRMISIYQLALFGCAPLGALFAGYAIEWWGVLQLLKVSAIASFVMFFCTFFTRELWDIEVVSDSNK